MIWKEKSIEYSLQTDLGTNAGPRRVWSLPCTDNGNCRRCYHTGDDRGFPHSSTHQYLQRDLKKTQLYFCSFLFNCTQGLKPIMTGLVWTVLASVYEMWGHHCKWCFLDPDCSRKDMCRDSSPQCWYSGGCSYEFHQNTRPHLRVEWCTLSHSIFTESLEHVTQTEPQPRACHFTERLQRKAGIYYTAPPSCRYILSFQLWTLSLANPLAQCEKVEIIMKGYTQTRL